MGRTVKGFTKNWPPEIRETIVQQSLLVIVPTRGRFAGLSPPGSARAKPFIQLHNTKMTPLSVAREVSATLVRRRGQLVCCGLAV